MKACVACGVNCDRQSVVELFRVIAPIDSVESTVRAIDFIEGKNLKNLRGFNVGFAANWIDAVIFVATIIDMSSNGFDCAIWYFFAAHCDWP